MDQHATAVTLEPSLVGFAQQLRHDLDAQRVLLFGSRARGQVRADGDYDLIIVSPQFAGLLTGAQATSTVRISRQWSNRSRWPSSGQNVAWQLGIAPAR